MADNKLKIIEDTDMLRRTKRETDVYNPDFTQAKTLEGAWYKTEKGYKKFKDLPEEDE